MEMNLLKGTCKYTAMVNCGVENCSTCGWNPVVRQARLKKIKRERAHLLKKKPQKCPLRNRTVVDQKQDLGMVLNCFSSTCELTQDGECRIFARMLEYWESRCGYSESGLSKKVENAHEQPN